MNRTRNREHITPLFGRHPRGNQGARGERRFNHQDTACEPADDAVAARKVVGERRHTQAELRHDQTVFGERMCKRLVARGINQIEAGTDDRYR